ncbi:hypothetical protein CLU79DRAFT_747334 [Phycomyces nitens]|nr:hypothetical protein CLU79DRAFT_747334 [Phycomyces nitens]
MAAAAGGLPLVPLSSFAKESSVHASAYALANETLTKAKQANPPLSVGALRRLIEDVRIEESSLDRVARQMQSVQSATAFNWDPDVLAKQIAILDCQLFGGAILKKQWLCQLDRQQTKLIPLLDFHRYLTHSIAHQVIYWAELMKCGPQAARVAPPVRQKDNLVSHLVRVAYLLLHAYRDFSGCAAILRALTMPEVRRLRRLWNHCPARTKDMFRELVQVISPLNNYQAYHDMLRHKIELFSRDHQRRGSAGIMIAIPWIDPHLLSIQSIITAYTAGDHYEPIEVSSFDPADLVLSSPGARKLAFVMSVLELCQHNSTTESIDLVEDALGLGAATSKRASTLKPIHLEGLRVSVIPISDLNRLAPGDPIVNHWLVSRVYLRKDQLMDESIEVEPLMHNEQIRSENDDRTEIIIPQTPLSRRPSTVILLPEEEDGPKEVQDDVDSSSQAEILREQVRQQEQRQKDERRDEAIERQNEQKIEQDLPNGMQQEIDQEVEPEETEDKSSQDKTLVPHADDWPGPAAPFTDAEQDQAQDGGVKSVAGQSVENCQDSTSSSTAKNTKKSRLSPTAPEFVPLKKSTTNTSILQASMKWRTGSPVLTDTPSPDMVDDDDQSEKWTGYHPTTLDPKQSLSGEDNVDDDDDEEIWRGYPGRDLSSISNETSPRRGSSQSEGSESWKGYEAMKMESDWRLESALKVKENDWQRYALGTLDEDELDSSTMLNGEFEKSRQARGQVEHGLFEQNTFRKAIKTSNVQPNPQNTNRFTP